MSSIDRILEISLAFFRVPTTTTCFLTIKTSNSSRHRNGVSMVSHMARIKQMVEYDFSPPVMTQVRRVSLGKMARQAYTRFSFHSTVFYSHFVRLCPDLQEQFILSREGYVTHKPTATHCNMEVGLTRKECLAVQNRPGETATRYRNTFLHTSFEVIQRLQAIC